MYGESWPVSVGILPHLELAYSFSSLHWHGLQTGSLLLALHFIRTRFQWYHTHIQAAEPVHHLLTTKGGFTERIWLRLCLSPHQCLLTMHTISVFLTMSPSPLSFIHTLNLSVSISLSPTLSPPFVVFVWLLGFVCLLFPDGRRRLHLCGFQVPRELFTALAQALILFPLAGLYDGPFIPSNWKQLSLPLCVGESGRTCLFSLCSPSEHLH